MKHLTKFSLTALALAMSASASADSVRINGFANLTGGISNEEAGALGFDKDIDFSNQSLFAIQVTGQINDKMSATAQIVSRGSDDFGADFEWAYIKYEMSENSSIVAGRFRLPVFRYSDSLDVGYSYHWINAPSSVYDVAFNNLNGIRYDYSTYAGDWEYLFQTSFGNYNEDISGGEVESSNVILVSGAATYESFKARLVWGTSETSFSQVSVDETLAQLSAASPAFAPLVDDLSLQDETGTFLGLGLEYDNFEWFVAGEYTILETEDSFSPKDVAYYVTAGTRLGKWTPHITYETRDGNDTIKFTDTVAALPAPLQAIGGAASAGLQTFFMEEYSIITAGVRYDWDTNIALKAEVSRYDNEIDSAVDINNTADSTLVKASVNLIF